MMPPFTPQLQHAIAARLQAPPASVASAWAMLCRRPVALNTTTFSVALASAFQAISLAPALRSIIHAHTPEL